MTFRISLAQMQIEPGKVDRILQRALEMIELAASRGSAVVILPELWSSGYDLENAARHAAASFDILAELQTIASHHQMIIAGSLLEIEAGRVFNTQHWITPDSPRSVSYRKIHLFRLMDEDRWLSAGGQIQQTPAPWGPTGLAICYDLRFPELFRRYALEGASAIAISAEWPARRIHHWDILLRARAIENQVFVLAVNCVGISGPETFGGSSVVLTPNGDALIQGSKLDDELLTTNIDPDLIRQVRAFMPVFQDRRPEIYHSSGESPS